jgi:hypothetical protein
MEGLSDHAFAVLLASTFTFGCAAIHALEQHARAMTAVLSILVLCLGPFVGLVSMVQKATPGPLAEQSPVAWILN